MVERAESTALGADLPPLERAYWLAAAHALDARDRPRLDSAREPAARVPSERELGAMLLSLLDDRRQLEGIEDEASAGALDRCAVGTYRELRRCADPHPLLYGECEPGPRLSRCIRGAYDTHALATAIHLIRRGAPPETLAGAIEEIIRQAQTRGTPRRVMVDRIVRGYGVFRSTPDRP
jgi:hypothetical protein